MTDIYGSVGAADTYHSERGNEAWAAAETDDKSAALIIATEWIDTKYRALFPGTKVGQRAQVREWPRYSAFDRDGYAIDNASVPVEVQNATFEVALRQIVSPGSLNTDYVAGENIKSVAVSGAVSISYGSGAMSALDMQLSIPVADRILAGILTGNPFSSISGQIERV